jgi:hypothetical protein
VVETEYPLMVNKRCFYLKVVGKFYKAVLIVIAITSFLTIDLVGGMLNQRQ